MWWAYTWGAYIRGGGGLIAGGLRYRLNQAHNSCTNDNVGHKKGNMI